MQKPIIRKYYIHISLIILGIILYFMANFHRVAVPGPIFDILQKDFSISAPYVTAFGAIFMYVYAIGNLFIGILVDKFSGIKVLLFGSIIFSLGAILFTHTNSLPLVYFARALLGLGAASFYLSLLQEAKKCFPDRYFGIAVSVIIFTGFLGGVFANAPFIAIVDKIGWRSALDCMTVFIIIATVLFASTQHLLKTLHENKKVHICLAPYLEVMKNKNNRYLFLFVAVNGGLYYALQTVIGVKFLKDFMAQPTSTAAFFLSCMIVVAAVSGMVLASLSKMFNNRRVIFLKIVAILSLVVFAFVSVFLVLDVKTPLVIALILMLSICGGMSPLTVPIVHATNPHEIRSTAVSIMNCFFFLTVGFVGTAIGFLLDLFPATKDVTGHLIYGNNSYLAVFLTFSILSIIEVFAAFKVKDKLETQSTISAPPIKCPSAKS